MSWTAKAVVAGATFGAGLLSAQQQAEADREANRVNERLGLLDINERRRQFEAQTGELSASRRQREDELNRQLQSRLDPFSTVGQQAVGEQGALLGLSGPEAQQAALGRFTESPGQQFLRERQERALLRNASAIGGLGGGNIRTALQEQAFGRAQTNLDRQIQQLGGLAGQGLQAAQTGRISTGADVGVRTGPAAAPEQVSGGVSGSGGGLLGSIQDAIGSIF